jgi:hypothetical protein
LQRRDNAAKEHWAFDGVDWTQRVVVVTAPLGQLQTLTYDGTRRQLVGMFLSGEQRYETTFDGTQWQQVAIEKGPAADQVRLVYDDAEGELATIEFSFGGATTLWHWNGTRWKSRQLQDSPPLTIGYLPAENQFIGLGSDIAGNLTIAQLDNDTWINQTTAIRVAGPFPLVLEANGHRQSLDLLVKSYDPELSIFRPAELRYANGTVEELPDGNAPPPRYNSVMTYDAGRGVVVQFGGGIRDFNTYGDTWEFDGTSWRGRELSGPSPRRLPLLTYDLAHQRVVLFGGDVTGEGDDPSNETWVYDGVAWSMLPIVAPPPGRSSPAFAYDDIRQRVVMFGGNSGANKMPYLTDTWEFDGSAWKRIDTAQSPPFDVDYSRMAFDHQRQRAVLSTTRNGLDIETWEYDGAAWRQQPTTEAPPRGAPLVYDVRRAVLAAVTDRALWTYTGATWQRRRTISRGGVPARAIAYNNMRGEIVRFGGVDPGTSDTWVLSFSTLIDPPDRCDSVEDSDGDSLRGCGSGLGNGTADPDCAARCNPMCFLGEACAATLPHCGDGVCNSSIENYRFCPVDCAVLP